jgi:hypothetical protein
MWLINPEHVVALITGIGNLVAGLICAGKNVPKSMNIALANIIRDVADVVERGEWTKEEFERIRMTARAYGKAAVCYLDDVME